MALKEGVCIVCEGLKEVCPSIMQIGDNLMKITKPSNDVCQRVY